MKLLVIVLCLFSERYLIHTVSHYRFYWFSAYSNAIIKVLPKTGLFINPFFVLFLIVIPILFFLYILFVLFGSILFGFIGFLINLLVFYYCLGPQNPFYPISMPDEPLDNNIAIGHYFSRINNQLFSVIFWFILTGALGVLCYRLLYLSKSCELTRSAANWIISFFDWIPVRITVLLYLLVGNFQQGFHYYQQVFFSSVENNETILRTGGLLAAQTHGEDSVSLPYAEHLVLHALILYLVFLAFFTLIAWL